MNPKLWLYFEALNKPHLGIEIVQIMLRLEAELKAYALLYPALSGKASEPIKDILQPEELCGLIMLYTGIPLLVGTERTSIYNVRTHQKVLNLEFRLPECKLLLDYEDLAVKEDFSLYTEKMFRESYIEEADYDSNY